MGLHGIERHEVLQLAKDGEVERSLAKQLIKVSVYWYEHPSGVPVNAPGHAKHIKTETTPNNWRIKFGANTFSISKAVSRCQSALIEFLDAAEQGNSASIEEIKKTLRFKICQSVENPEGYEYGLYRTNCENHMIFGATSICVDDFVNCILQKCQTFKKANRQPLAICPTCLKRFENNLDLKYHQKVVHDRKRR